MRKKSGAPFVPSIAVRSVFIPVHPQYSCGDLD
jgi:hypothetical protein